MTQPSQGEESVAPGSANAEVGGAAPLASKLRVVMPRVADARPPPGQGERRGEAATAPPGQRALLDVLVEVLEHRQLRAAATAAATTLATQLGCERVSIGFLARKQVRLEAISRNASFDQRTAMSRAIEAAMAEAIDQDAVVVYPPAAGARPQSVGAHEDLASRLAAAAVCTVPFADGETLAGAVTFEHGEKQRFDPLTVAYCTAVVALIGPLLETRRREERSLPSRIADKGREFMRALLGPRHIAAKLCGLLAGLLVAVGLIGSGTYRVSADAVLKGTIQRVITAPVDGFIAAAPARAGDVVRAGQVLAELDDRSLALEQVKWASERDRLLKEYREAMAELDSLKVTVLRAQLDRANAELALAEENLARSRITAPLDGVVVSGDLSQAVGSPVKQGDLLFEVTPLDGYRVMLKVDERDIGAVEVGQRGRLALAGLPGEHLPFVVARVTPVSEVSDGRNYFTVEARLDRTPANLRPGMQGVAKLDAGSRSLGWIWTHRIVDWVRIKSWTWFPWA